MEFEWDERKAAANRRKHKIDFTDAITVFDDLDGWVEEDRDARGEQRLKAIGMDQRGRVLVVLYTYRGDTIRPFSARKALAPDRRRYFDERQD